MQQISKGTFNTDHGLLFFVVVLLLTALLVFLFINIYSFTYLQLDRLLPAIAFTLFAIYVVLKGGQEFKAVDIYEDHLKIKWAWGLLNHKIYPADITLVSRSAKDKTEYFIIKTRRYNILFLERSLENNIELSEQLKNWGINRSDNISFEKLSGIEKRLAGILYMIFGVFMLFCLVKSYLTEERYVEKNGLTTIQGHLQSVPDIKKRSFRSAAEFVTFKLEEYPGYEFEITGPGYDAANLNDIENYRKGSPVALLIPAREFDIKIKRSAAPSFSEKHFRWNIICVYGILINSRQILTLERYNENTVDWNENNRMAGVLILGMAIFIFVYGLKTFRYRW